MYLPSNGKSEMKARVLKDISPIIKAVDILVKRGKNYILEGYKKPEIIPNKQWNKDKNGYDEFKTPNYYVTDLVEYNKVYFELFK